MYKPSKPQSSKMTVNRTYKGETIEQKIERIVNNKEPIKDGAPLIYTERKEGVLAEMDIRTDRWEIAAEAMSHVDKSHKAKREAKILEMNPKPKDDGKPESTQGTNQQSETPNK